MSNSWNFYETAAPIRAETSVFHISRLFHNVYFSSICKHIFAYFVIWTFIETFQILLVKFPDKPVKPVLGILRTEEERQSHHFLTRDASHYRTNFRMDYVSNRKE